MEDFKLVKIHASPKQMSKLRNGHPVRVTKGEGVNLIVHPHKYNHITKSFGSGKGAIVQLSPEELAANKGVEGGSIFGKKADRWAKKHIGKKAVKEIHNIAKAFEPLVQQGIDAASSLASTYGVPPEATAALSGMAKGYISNPSAYRGKSGSSKDALIGMAKDKLTSMGTDYLKATNPDLYSQAQAVKQNYDAIKAAQQSPDAAFQRWDSTSGWGLYAGSGGGLYAGRGYGLGGSLLSVSNHALPPALQSQNSGANFHFSTQLPPNLLAYVRS